MLAILRAALRTALTALTLAVSPVAFLIAIADGEAPSDAACFAFCEFPLIWWETP